MRKIIVATDALCSGEIYLSREGRNRRPFSNFAEFCIALRATAGWFDDSPHSVVLANAAPSKPG